MAIANNQFHTLNIPFETHDIWTASEVYAETVDNICSILVAQYYRTLYAWRYEEIKKDIVGITIIMVH